MTTKTVNETATETLDRHIDEHRKRVEELRHEFGDPAERLGALLRDRFTPEALARARREHRLNRSSWLEEDDLEEDGR